MASIKKKLELGCALLIGILIGIVVMYALVYSFTIVAFVEIISAIDISNTTINVDLNETKIIEEVLEYQR